MNIKFLLEKTEQKEVYVIANSLNEAEKLLKEEFPGFIVKEICGNLGLSYFVSNADMEEYFAWYRLKV